MIHDILYSPVIIISLGMLALVFIYHEARKPGSVPSRVVNGLITLAETHAKTQALQYFIVACLVLGAFTGALYDNLWSIDVPVWDKLGWWQKLGVWSKCLSTAPAVVIAWLMKSPLPEKKDSSQTSV